MSSAIGSFLIAHSLRPVQALNDTACSEWELMEAVMDYIYICIVRIRCNEFLKLFKIT